MAGSSLPYNARFSGIERIPATYILSAFTHLAFWIGFVNLGSPQYWKKCIHIQHGHHWILWQTYLDIRQQTMQVFKYPNVPRWQMCMCVYVCVCEFGDAFRSRVNPYPSHFSCVVSCRFVSCVVLNFLLKRHSKGRFGAWRSASGARTAHACRQPVTLHRIHADVFLTSTWTEPDTKYFYWSTSLVTKEKWRLFRMNLRRHQQTRLQRFLTI